ncbi:MAG: alpha/beta hydrolase, partial [Proteobacteria bacterium]|nr:alpha/beta hydrolase [Pseudomonadota bacterium]
ALQTLFNLSPAEARLAALLASGMSLNQAAEQSYISKNTAKVQLKSIFSKTGVSRQAELTKLILTSPAVLNPADEAPEETRLKTKTRSRINQEGHFTLSDGRHLQYAEYGDPEGDPVIHIHGILGCRYERHPDDSLTKSLGVRLIIPDRPGYGLSEYAPDHGYLDFADDLLELVDHLGLKQFSIMGLSIGAIYGSAFAYKAPERLRSMAMISSTPPFRSFSDFEGIPASLKLLTAFSKYLPTAAQMIAEIAITNGCNNPEKFLDNIPVSTADRAIFSRALLKQHFEKCLLEGSKNCHAGFVHDILLSAKPWPFAVENIGTKIDFWHGTDDSHSPFSRIKPVIDTVPESRLFHIEGGGHFLIYDHWQEILESLIDEMPTVYHQLPVAKSLAAPNSFA